jgi:chromosome segregation ATPase
VLTLESLDRRVQVLENQREAHMQETEHLWARLAEIKAYGREAVRQLEDQTMVTERLEKDVSEIMVTLAAHGARFDRIDARFDGIDTRLAAYDQRFDGIDTRLAAQDQRFDQVDAVLREILDRLPTR